MRTVRRCGTSCCVRVGESVTVKELDEVPALDPESDDGELAFRAGELETAFTREALDALDVRDKDDLTARRRARSRDLLLWRIFLGAAAAIVFALLLEVGVIGGKFWQKGRTAIVDARAPEVARIEKQNALATSIEELSTKRLLPFEMIYLVEDEATALGGVHTGVGGIEFDLHDRNPGSDDGVERHDCVPLGADGVGGV